MEGALRVSTLRPKLLHSFKFYSACHSFFLLSGHQLSFYLLSICEFSSSVVMLLLIYNLENESVRQINIAYIETVNWFWMRFLGASMHNCHCLSLRTLIQTKILGVLLSLLLDILYILNTWHSYIWPFKGELSVITCLFSEIPLANI